MKTTVELGRAFESVVFQRLSGFGASLTQSGGAFDQCVDLSGSWTLPWPKVDSWPGDALTLRYVRGEVGFISIPLVVQCKATKSPVGVATVREFAHAIASRFPEHTLGVIATTGGFAQRSLQREREWATRDILFLHMTTSGALLHAAYLSRSGSQRRYPFLTSPLSRPRHQHSSLDSSSICEKKGGGEALQ